MHYVPSKYEKIGSILQNRTEINHSRSVLEGLEMPQGYETPSGYVPDDYEFKGVNHAQLALEIPDNWWQNMGVEEGHADEDNLPRLMFRGIPSDEVAGASAAENYHYMARHDEFRRLREDFRYHRDDCRKHVPLITPGDIPGYGQQGKFLRPGSECDHYGYGGRHPEWAMINPIDMPISADLPIIYDRFNGLITHQAQDSWEGPISNDNVYNTIRVNATGHVTWLSMRILQTLTPGAGFSSGSQAYNTSTYRTWDLNFTTPAGGINGAATTVARGDHHHAAHYVQNGSGLLGSTYNGSDEVSNWRVDFGTGSNQAARGNHNHDSNYVLKAGDTMTGELTISTDGYNATYSSTAVTAASRYTVVAELDAQLVSMHSVARVSGLSIELEAPGSVDVWASRTHLRGGHLLVWPDPYSDTGVLARLDYDELRFRNPGTTTIYGAGIAEHAHNTNGTAVRIRFGTSAAYLEATTDNGATWSQISWNQP